MGAKLGILARPMVSKSNSYDHPGQIICHIIPVPYFGKPVAPSPRLRLVEQKAKLAFLPT